MKVVRQNIPGFILLFVIWMGCSSTNQPSQTKGLKDVFNKQFYIGAALNKDQIKGSDSAAIRIVKKHFNSIVAENCMKSEEIQPTEGEFDFSMADKFVEFGEQNNMFIIGHTLIWHSQAPEWFFEDENGNDVSREALISRMKSHISIVVGRYKGRIHGWDVVNEAILDDGSWRKSKFYEIIGEDFIKLAFQFAHEADPEAQLYYNDYSMTQEGKRDGVIKMVKSLQQQGIRIDGVGMQGHVSLKAPAISEFEKSILAYADLDVQVMVTELDITVLPWPGGSVSADVALSHEFKEEFDPYSQYLPDSVEQALNDRYLQFFLLFEKHQDLLSRVTLWGVNDTQSWRNYWPVDGRTDFPLLFDRNYHPKPVVQAIVREN